jgi:Glutamine amidotransferases class-II
VLDTHSAAVADRSSTAAAYRSAVSISSCSLITSLSSVHRVSVLTSTATNTYANLTLPLLCGTTAAISLLLLLVNRVLLSSEVGVLPGEDEAGIRFKARLEPGKMFLVDLQKGEIVPDDVVKEDYASRKPYGDWVERNLLNLKDWAAKTVTRYKVSVVVRSVLISDAL